MDEKLTKQLNIAIGIVFIAAAGILVAMAASRQSKVGPNGPEESATSTEATSLTTADYDALKGMKQIMLAQNMESWTPDAKLSADKTVSKQLMVKGNFDKAFLVAKASEGGDALTRWDSFFFKLNDLGGHLFRPLSLPTPAAQDTSLLYNLKDVAVLPNVPYDENRTPDHDDLSALLKDGHTVVVTSFISSLRQSQIDELSISYACASGSDCSLAIK